MVHSVLLRLIHPLQQPFPVHTNMFCPKPRHPTQCFIRHLKREIGIAHQTLPQELNAMVHVPFVERRVARSSSVSFVVRWVDGGPVDVADGVLFQESDYGSAG